MTGTRVALMLADVDGTLGTSDEVLTDRTLQGPGASRAPLLI